MQTVRIVSLMAAAGLAWSLAAQAADGDRQPPAPPEPARQPPSATSPSGTDRTDHSKEQERAVKPPTDASMGAVERKPEPVPDSGRNK
jgi:hypothetical protein